MTRNDRINAALLAVEAWAREEIAKLGPRPTGVCPKPEDLIYATVPMLAQAAEIEEAMRYVSECLEADRYHEGRPKPPSERAAAALERFAPRPIA